MADDRYHPVAVYYAAGVALAILFTCIYIAETPAIHPGGQPVLPRTTFYTLAIVVLSALGTAVTLASRAARTSRFRARGALAFIHNGMLAPFRREDSEVESALRQQQVRHITTQLYVMMAINIINAILVTMSIWNHVGHVQLMAWGGIVSGWAVMGMYARWRIDRETVAHSYSKRTIRRITFQAGVRGLLWGACFATFFADANPTGKLILLSVALGMLAGGVPALAPVPSAALLFGLGIVIPTLLRLVALGNFEHLVLAMFGLAFSGSMVMIAIQLYRNFAGNFLARRERDEQAATISLLLREFESSSSDWLWEIDEDGYFQRLPKRMADLCGIERRKTSKINVEELFARLEGGEIEDLKDCLRQAAPFRDITVKTRDANGWARWLSFSASPLHKGGFRGVGSDVTERTLARLQAASAQRRAEQAERRLADSIDLLRAGFVLSDAGGRMVMANRRVREMFPVVSTLPAGTDLETIASAQAMKWALTLPDADDGWLDSLKLACEKTHRGPVDLKLPTGMWLRVETQETAEGGFVSLLTDITDIKEAEERLEQQARHLAASNRELKKFAEVASHDLQEPLRKIETFGTRLAVHAMDELDERGALFLTRITAATQRMRQLIGDLTLYSRTMRQHLQIVPVDLDQSMQAIDTHVAHQLRRLDGTLVYAGLGSVRGDQSQLRELLEILVLNAIKFARPGVPPRIVVTRSRNERQPASLQIVVADNGIGFDMKHHDQIFEIFQRLHSREAYEGTGVGLATCRKIAERHGGSIRAESVPGEGARFIVTLPNEVHDIEQAGDAAA
ncbi:MAG: ATP-binding protein [Hyphomicrobiaceae bacterium]